MSVQTEIDRIKNAKTAISTAIASKGVTVPDATLLDGMAALIESIEAGGGGGGKAWFISNITIAEDVNPGVGLEITHNLGFIPAMIFVQDVSTSKVLKGQVIFQISLVYKRTDGTGKFNRQSIHIVTGSNGGYLPYSFTSSTMCVVGLAGNLDTIREAHIASGTYATVCDVTENTVIIGYIGGYAETYKLKAGRTYRLIMGGIA